MLSKTISPKSIQTFPICRIASCSSRSASVSLGLSLRSNTVSQRAFSSSSSLKPSNRPFRSILSVSSRYGLTDSAFGTSSYRRNYSAVTVDSPAPIIGFAEMKELVVKENTSPTTPSPTPIPNDYLILDVREPDEYAQGHIPLAVNLPYKSAPGALGLEPEEFHETFGFDKPSTDKALVFYCLGGVRATAAESLAATFGYNKRLNYFGSYSNWLQNGGPVVIPETGTEADSKAAKE